MTESISTEQARVEVALLRVKMYHSCGTYTGEKFQEISDQLCLLLKVLEYRKKLDKQLEKQQRRLPPP